MAPTYDILFETSRDTWTIDRLPQPSAVVSIANVKTNAELLAYLASQYRALIKKVGTDLDRASPLGPALGSKVMDLAIRAYNTHRTVAQSWGGMYFVSGKKIAIEIDTAFAALTATKPQQPKVETSISPADPSTQLPNLSIRDEKPSLFSRLGEFKVPLMVAGGIFFLSSVVSKPKRKMRTPNLSGLHKAKWEDEEETE